MVNSDTLPSKLVTYAKELPPVPVPPPPPVVVEVTPEKRLSSPHPPWATTASSIIASNPNLAMAHIDRVFISLLIAGSRMPLGYGLGQRGRFGVSIGRSS